MKDLNFFSSYNKKSDKKSIDKSFVLYSVIAFIITAVFIYGLYNFILISKLNNDIAALKIEAETKNQSAKIKEVLTKEQEISSFEESISKLSVLDKYVEDRDIINEILLEDIQISIPPDLFFNSMIISQDSIRIEGKSKDKESIAQFQHNLKGIEGLDQVFVPEVMDDNGYYSFYLDAKFEEEKPDGDEAGK